MSSMGLRQRTATLILSSLLSGALAVSFGELGLSAPPSSEPAACNRAYRSTIPNCSLTDFDNGCSALCTAGAKMTFDGLTLECSPGYVSTLLGSSLSSVGVKLFCPSPLLGEDSAESKSASGSAQTTSAKSSQTTLGQTTLVSISRTSINLAKSSSTSREKATTGSPVISQGPPPNRITILAPEVASLPNLSSLSLVTSALLEPARTVSGITITASYVTSSFLTRATNPIPTGRSNSTASASSVSPPQYSNGATALPVGGIGKDGSTKQKKSSTGPIVGGILGGVAVIALLIILAFNFVVRPQGRRQAEEDGDYKQKAAPFDRNTLTQQVTPGGPRYSAAHPYPSEPPTMIMKPYRSNSNRFAPSELVRDDSRVSMRSIGRSNSMSDRYDVSSVDRYGSPMWDPYSNSPSFDRYGPYGSLMDDGYGPYSTSPMSINRYDTSPVAPISFMEAEWNYLRGQPQMPPNSNHRRPMFNNYPSVIQEERESNITPSIHGSMYELAISGSSSKISVRRSEDSKPASARKSEDKKRTGTPEVPRRSPLRVVNGAAEN